MSLSDKRYIYLAGKIKLGHGATEYRAVAAPRLLKAGIHSLDPLRGKYALKSWKSLDPNEVVVRDLQDIDRAHVVLAVMMKCEDSSFGTPCEIMYAWERKIPVVMITDEAYLADHFWPKSLVSHIFFVDEKNGQTFDDVLLEAVDHICHWYGETVEGEIYDAPSIVQEKTGPGGCPCGPDCKCGNVDDCPCTEDMGDIAVRPRCAGCKEFRDHCKCTGSNGPGGSLSTGESDGRDPRHGGRGGAGDPE